MLSFSIVGLLIILVLVVPWMHKESLLRATFGQPHMLHAPVALPHETVDLVVSRSEIRNTLDGALDKHRAPQRPPQRL